MASVQLKNEVEYDKIDGVKFELLKTPVEIVDETGKRNVSPINDCRKLFKTDSVIIAVNQGPRDNIVSTTKGIDSIS